MKPAPFDPMLGRVPSGIYILTIARDGQSTGMLASWAMQAGFEPPMLTVAVKQGRYVCDWLTAGAPFVLNVVGKGDKHLLKHFARGFEPEQPAFEGLETEPAPCGVPRLNSAIGYLECEPAGYVDSGDHRVFLAKVVGGDHTGGDEAPMVHIRKSGKHY